MKKINKQILPFFVFAIFVFGVSFFADSQISIDNHIIVDTNFSANGKNNIFMENNFQRDTLFNDGNSVLVAEFYGHASLKFEFEGKNIYIDPVSEYADYSKLAKADLILITHEHYDHFDKKAVDNLTKDDTKIIANPNTVSLLGKGEALKNHENTVFCGIKISSFEAYNTTSGRDKFHPKGRDNGYLLEFGDKKIYISGDTEIIEDTEKLRNIDVLFIAVNQPYTMTINQALHYTEQVNPKTVYPYHTTDTDMNELEKVFSELKNTRPVIRKME